MVLSRASIWRRRLRANNLPDATFHDEADRLPMLEDSLTCVVGWETGLSAHSDAFTIDCDYGEPGRFPISANMAVVAYRSSRTGPLWQLFYLTFAMSERIEIA